MRIRFYFVLAGLVVVSVAIPAVAQQEQSKEETSENQWNTEAKQYLTEHDDNKDGYLQRTELPLLVRDRFAAADTNDDERLTSAEIQNGGIVPRSSTRQQSTRTEDTDTWSKWWDSWWSDENNTRDRDTGAESGAQRFVKQHDTDNDGYVERTELPLRMRGEFASVDRNSDGYLSLTEVRTGGLQRFTNRTTRSATARSDRNESESWSQWWSSWWDDNDGKNTSEGGAKEFVTRYDRNKDGYIAQPEMPRSMKDEFAQIDRDNDQRLSNLEIQQFAESNREQISRSGNRRMRTPVEVAFVWITTPQQGRVTRRDLQEVYSLLYELDANRNGRISQSELDEHCEQAVAEWSDERFISLDDNSDSRLSQEEAKDTIFESDFEKLDQDNNNSLTREEIRKSIQDKFDKSENTQASNTTKTRREE